MMFDGDDEPKKKSPYQLGQNIDDLSVGDLTELIDDLKQEIVRLEKEADAKGKSLGAAQALFKSWTYAFKSAVSANTILTLMRY